MLLSREAVKQGLSQKLSSQFEGPYEVLDVLEDTPNVVIRLARSPRSRDRRVHINQLRPYYRQGSDHGELVTGRSGMPNTMLEEYLPP